MDTSRVRRWVAGLAVTALPLIGVAFGSVGAAAADDCLADPFNPACVGGSAAPPAATGDSGGVQFGEPVIPAGGGGPVIAMFPAGPGDFVITSDGGLVIPMG